MSRIRILDKEFETTYDECKMQEVVNRVAEQINRDLDGKDPLFLCVLNGAFMFASDLMKRVSIPLNISFVKLASYAGMSSTGTMKELIGLNEDIKGRTVVIVEDVVDTGMTIEGLKKQIAAKGAKEILVATLLFKPGSCQIEGWRPEYVGLNIPNDFIVGYGLDYDGYGRNIPEIMTLVKD